MTILKLHTAYVMHKYIKHSSVSKQSIPIIPFRFEDKISTLCGQNSLAMFLHSYIHFEPMSRQKNIC